jgi:xylan 1,4-beta-xylosidase
LPNAKVGGPETADGGPDYLRGFFEHCLRGQNAATGKIGSPLDFLSFHAKGRPEYLVKDGYVRMGIARQLSQIDIAMEVIASFPELRKKPIVIGESDPEGAAAAQGPQLGYRYANVLSNSER